MAAPPIDGRAWRGLALSQSHLLAFVQQMRAERDDAIARLEVADDRSRFVAESGDLHGTPRDPRRFPFDQPYAGTLAGIEDRADRDLQRRDGPAVRDLDGDGRAQRRVCQTALQHVPRLERSSLTVCGVRQLAKFRRAREPASIQSRPAGRSDRRAQSFGKLDDRLASSGMRHTHDDLAGSDNLPRLRQRLDHHAVRIGEQDGVARFVAGDVGLGLGRVELRSCRLGGSLDLVVGRCRNRSRGDEVAVARLVLRRLARARLGGGNRLLVRARGEPQVRGIDAHERLAALDRLPGIDQALQNLPGHAEPQVALHPGRDDSGERTLRLDGGLDGPDSHERGLRPRIVRRSCVVACCQDEGQQTEDGNERDITALKHGDLRECECVY